MNRATSIYLDAVRFLAALTVFVGHASFRENTGGLLWQVFPYSLTAVIVFFVLSGYVIAHVTSTREKNALDYAVSRFGRLYSVVLPAIVLTAICEYLILGQDAYGDSGSAWSVLKHYVATLLFVNRFWFDGPLEPLLNGPFWSLSYEVTYYIAAGFMIFWKGAGRIIALAVLAMLAGPSIVVLAPIWLLGYATYFHVRDLRPRALLGLLLWIGSIGVLLMTPLLRSGTEFLDAKVLYFDMHETNGTLMADYVAGFAFSIHLIGFAYSASAVETLFVKCESALRWLGSLTFVLYLFHVPLLNFFRVYSVGDPESLSQRLWILSGPLLFVCIAGPLIERSKIYYRRAVLAGRDMIFAKQLKTEELPRRRR